MSSTVKSTHRNLMRVGSYYTSDPNQKEDPRFGKLLSAVTEKELGQFMQVLEEDELPVRYQEPALGNRTPLHYATKSNFLDGVRHLLKNGADCNAVDDNGLTPLHMAAAEGYVDICKELLSKGANVHAQDKKGRTALHWAITPTSEVEADTEQSAIQIVKLLLMHGACHTAKDKDSRLPIHLAAQAGDPATVRLLLSGHGIGTASVKDFEKRTPLHYSVLAAKSLETITVLLDRYASIDDRDWMGRTALHLVAGRTATLVDEEFDIACLEILLNRGASVHIDDNDGCNPLALALTRTMWWGRGSSRDFLLTVVQMLVAKGSKITCCFTMWRMIEAFPPLLHYTLNHSLKTNTSVDNSVYLILEFDMRGLIATEKLQKFSKAHSSPQADEIVLPPALASTSDVSILHYMIVTGNNHVLSHPLCRTFLHLKWLKIRKYFVFNFLLNCLFVLSLTNYVFLMTSCSADVINQGSLNSSGTILNNDSEIASMGSTNQNETWSTCLENLLNFPGSTLPSWIALSAILIVIAIRELVQFTHSPLDYFFSIKRMLTLILLVLIPIMLLIPCPCTNFWWKQVGAVTVVGSWISLLLSIGQFPVFGVFIVMFSTVATNVLKFLGLYMLLLIAFAFGFHVLLRPYITFYSLFTSLSTTFVMMTGELDYEAVFVQEGSEKAGLLGVIGLLFFIFLVYVILSNLLVGLAVSDLTAIRKRSELMRLTTQVQLIVQFEGIIRSYILPHCMQTFLKRSISLYSLGAAPIITVTPNEKRGWVTKTYRLLSNVVGQKLLIKIFESFVDGFLLPEAEHEIPGDLLKASLNIALKQFEIEKRDRLLRQRPAVSSRFSTVLNRMPMPLLPKKKRQWGVRDTNLASNFSDGGLDEDDDDTTELNMFPDDQPFLAKSKFLTVRKSSRKNRWPNRNCRMSIRSFPSNFDNAMDQEDIRQTLYELQMTLDNLEESLYPSTPFPSRRQSMKSSKIFEEVSV